MCLRPGHRLMFAPGRARNAVNGATRSGTLVVKRADRAAAIDPIGATTAGSGSHAIVVRDGGSLEANRTTARELGAMSGTVAGKGELQVMNGASTAGSGNHPTATGKSAGGGGSLALTITAAVMRRSRADGTRGTASRIEQTVTGVLACGSTAAAVGRGDTYMGRGGGQVGKRSVEFNNPTQS